MSEQFQLTRSNENKCGISGNISGKNILFYKAINNVLSSPLTVPLIEGTVIGELKLIQNRSKNRF